MKTAVEDVEKFMRAAGQETPDVPSMTETAKLYFGDPEDGCKRHPSTGFAMPGGLVGEEISEMAEAWAKGDDVGVLDGGLDAIWTIIAGLRALGFPIVLGWEEVAMSNHAKIDPLTGMCIRREGDGKILKPEGWKPPNLRAVLNGHAYDAIRVKFGNVRVEHVAGTDYTPDPCTE